jgi:hypothetical protein
MLIQGFSLKLNPLITAQSLADVSWNILYVRNIVSPHSDKKKTKRGKSLGDLHGLD